MRLACLLLCLLPCNATLVARDFRNGTLWWKYSGGPLLQKDGGSTLIMFGADAVTDIVAFNSNAVWATTPTCVLRLEKGVAHARIGSIAESGIRYGPLLYSRFVSLVHLAVLSESVLLLVDAQQLLLADAWHVRPLSTSLSDLSYSLPLLTISPLNSSHMVFLTPQLARIMVLHALVLVPQKEMPSAATSWVSSLFYAPDIIFLGDSNANLWLWHGLRLFVQPPYSGGKLLPGMWTFVFSTQETVPVNITLDAITHATPTFAPIDSRSTWPYVDEDNLLVCPLGYLLVKVNSDHLCFQAPGGGYTTADAKFYPCPAGTYNPVAMAITPTACIVCPPSTIAPFPSSAVCSHCPLLAPYQSADGITCHSTCPPYNRLEAMQCVQCPPGMTIVREECDFCPENTYSNADGQCVPCPFNQYAPVGATACFSPYLDCHDFVPAVYSLATYTNNNDNMGVVAARNGTLFRPNNEGGLWILSSLTNTPLYTRPLLTSTAIITALCLTHDETVLYVAGPGALYRTTDLLALAYPSYYVPESPTALVATPSFLYVLDGSTVVRLGTDEQAARFMSNVLHITPYDGDTVLALVRSSANWLQIITVPQQQLMRTLPYSPSTTWILRASQQSATLAFWGHAIVLWPDDPSGQSAYTVIAGDVAVSARIDDQLPLALFDRITAAAFIPTSSSILLLEVSKFYYDKFLPTNH